LSLAQDRHSSTSSITLIVVNTVHPDFAVYFEVNPRGKSRYHIGLAAFPPCFLSSQLGPKASGFPLVTLGKLAPALTYIGKKHLRSSSITGHVQKFLFSTSQTMTEPSTPGPKPSSSVKLVLLGEAAVGKV
jgi:hypothetical protein